MNSRCTQRRFKRGHKWTQGSCFLATSPGPAEWRQRCSIAEKEPQAGWQTGRKRPGRGAQVTHLSAVQSQLPAARLPPQGA